MSRYAEIDENNVVIRIIVADDDYIYKLDNPSKWIRTHKDRSLRKNYAGIGHKYDKNMDAFVPPKPYDSWLLDADSADWKAPIPEPKDGKVRVWNELAKNWDEIIL